MRDICQRYSTKLGINLNLLIFLYGGKQIDEHLTFNEMSPNENEIKIIVIKREQDELICPKCGEIIIVNSEKIDEIVNNMNNIKETINGIKAIIDNLIKTSMQNLMNIQLKSINLLLNNVNEDISKNNEKINNLIKENTFTNYQQNKNIIRGLINIDTADIKKDILLFYTEINNDIDVFINNQKINVIRDNGDWKYNFPKEGNYTFEIIFKKNITNMKGFFNECTHIISLDLSDFYISNVTNMSFMFNECHKLKEIKGINKFNNNKETDLSVMFNSCKVLEYLDLSNFNTSNAINMSFMFANCHKLKEIKGISKFITNKVIDMGGMFQECKELEYLDLSNFDTSNVTNMSFMFANCHKLKEIKGINQFNTNKVADMNTMFQACHKLEYLHLSNFNTSNVINMSWMFNQCNELKYLNLLNFSINCHTKNMLKFKNKKNCQFITNNKDLLNLYKSS